VALACAAHPPGRANPPPAGPLGRPAGAATNGGTSADEVVADTLHGIVAAARLPELRWPDFTDYQPHLQQLYEQNGWRLLWTSDDRPTVQARAVVAQLAKADEAGLRADDYDAAKLAARLGAVTAKTRPAELAQLDAALSVSLMRDISDLHIGRVNPEKAGFQLDVGPKKYDLPQLVTEIAQAKDAPAILARVEPPFERYTQLERALSRYRTLAADPKLQPPPDLTGLKPGGRNLGVPALRRWLVALGDIPHVNGAGANGDLYTGEVVEGVKRFQERHGLTDDGVIGKATAQALQVPLRQRVRQIELSLERWRWLPESFAHPPLVVNIPEFRLHALNTDDGRVTASDALTMKVIVGKAMQTETPVFSGDMEYVVFRPYWNVPYSIVTKEMLPKLRKDPGYLARERLEVVRSGGGPAPAGGALAGLASGALGLRQRPGPDNSLGLVKFIFPNDESVYLHGTPAKHLFAKQRRDFSHGCIRVEDPVALAEYVLRGQPGWTRERILDAMTTGGTSTVTLAEPIPVYVVYVTAAAQPGGEVGFFEDLYGHDAELERILAKGPPYTGE
jgi:murein L,D-transpeptidase YcbB/YkuD